MMKKILKTKWLLVACIVAAQAWTAHGQEESSAKEVADQAKAYNHLIRE